MLFSWRSAHRSPSSSTEIQPDLEQHPAIQPIRTADVLLKPRGQALAEIQELCGFPPEHFTALVLPLLRSVAEWCQAMPASEAHHHARPFGLLDHSLEVAILALRLRRGILLPEGASAEVLAEHQDRWTYAVLAAALIHDLGKPAIDQIVTLFMRGRSTRENWNPWAGPMTKISADSYQAVYRKDRRHRLHDRAKPMFVPWWVPPHSVQWMAADMNLLAEWIAVLHGESSGPLVGIVNQADSASVARDLQGSVSVPLLEQPSPTPPQTSLLRRDAGPRPLHERLLIALRHLIQEGELPLNRNGAAGWSTPDGLWMVSKRTADALRQHLIGIGVGGIPNSNERIFDVLQEHGVLIPNGDRAIWKASVTNGEWRHTLTLLRFSLPAVWPKSEDWPEEFAGLVTWDEADYTSQDAGKPRLIPIHDEPHNMQEQSISYVQHDLAGNTPHAQQNSPEHLFLKWLREGVASRKLEINTKNARIHRIAEGLILVSPAIFQDFAMQNGNELEWKHVQTRVRKLGMHRKTGTGENFHTFLAEGQRKSGMLKGMLFPDEYAVLPDQEKLALNSHIKLVIE